MLDSWGQLLKERICSEEFAQRSKFFPFNELTTTEKGGKNEIVRSNSESLHLKYA